MMKKQYPGYYLLRQIQKDKKDRIKIAINNAMILDRLNYDTPESITKYCVCDKGHKKHSIRTGNKMDEGWFCVFMGIPCSFQ